MIFTVSTTMRCFNTAGPVDCQRHYCLPPLTRFDLDEVLLLIQQMKYFVLHAPRQTGKTSCLLALMDYLNSQGDYRCAYVNVEVAQAARENVAAAMQAILAELASWARRTDLLIIWPYGNQVQKGVIELKVLHKSLEQTLAQGLQQTCAYMDRCGTAEGHLVIFDRTLDKSWEDKLFRRQEQSDGTIITVWGM